MPMIDVYAAEGTFTDKHTLAQNLAQAVMRWEVGDRHLKFYELRDNLGRDCTHRTNKRPTFGLS